MTISKGIRWAVVGGAGLIACATDFQASDDGPLGQARVTIEEAPADVQCVQIQAAGSSVTSHAFDIAPGESSVFLLSALPLGAVAFSAEAFSAACSDVSDGVAASWVAEPVTETLLAGVVADVTLTMHRNGQAAVAVDFAAEGTCANGVQDGLETGIDCGGDCLPCSADPPGAEPVRPLLFSEYVEGSSTYKALELSALADTSFDGCRVAIYYNGETTATGPTLSGTLLAGETHVLCSSALSSAIGSCDQTAALTFNGDDAIVLECDGVAVDAIGQVGFDPGTAWGSGELSLLDHTLRRSCTSSNDTNVADAFDPTGQWSGHVIDSFDDLGVRACP